MNNNTLTNEIETLSDSLSSTVYTDLLDGGLSPEAAWEGTFGGDFSIVDDAAEDPVVSNDELF